MQHFSTFQRKETPHAATWMYLEDIMLNETSPAGTKGQTLHNPTHMTPNSQIYGAGRWLPGTGERGMGSYCFQSMELQFEMTDGDDDLDNIVNVLHCT